jgi:hypothetical protein
MAPPDPTETFWAWFSRHIPTVDALQDNLPLGDELHARLEALGVSGWEATPPDEADERDIFALSVNSLEELALVEGIAAAAPEMAGWTVCAGKPKKAWEGFFSWSTREQAIDSRDWRAILRRYPDGLHDVELIFDDEVPEDEEDLLMAFVVESEIGQVKALKRIYSIYRSRSPDAADRLRAVPLSKLDGLITDH